MKTKKIMASLLAAGMILSISACSNNTENTTVVTDSISTDIYYEETEEPEETEPFDPETFDWESIYTWDENTITGLNDVPESVKDYGVLRIPSRCTRISASAFSLTDWVNTIEFENSDNIEEIGYLAFSSMDSLHNFVCPSYFISTETHPETYYEVFASITNNIRGIVAADGKMDINFFRFLGDIQTQLSNQMTLETLYLPENFELDYYYWNSFQDRYYVVAKYTEDWFNNSEYFQLMQTSDYSTSSNSTFPTEPLTVYVVEGSWADEHFDDFFVGDLVIKEYWDGVNYELPYENYWDVESLYFYDNENSANYIVITDEGKVKYKEGSLDFIDLTTITEEQRQEIINTIFNNIESGALTEASNGHTAGDMYISYYGEVDGREYYYLTDSGSNVIEDLLASYNISF